MQCAVGTYTGDGIDGTAITGVGFPPDLVIVKAQGLARFAIFRTVSMIGDASMELGNAAGLAANWIESLDADGFTVGDAAQVNQADQPYYWQAWRDAGRRDFAYGVYLGNGVDDRNVVAGLPFTPALVAIKRDGLSVGVWKPSSLGGDATLYFTNLAFLSDRIQALSADGFQVGAALEVNAAGDNCYWFAFGAAPGMMNVGTYVGNFTADRFITGAGFPPDSVWVKGEGATWGRHKPSNLAGVVSLHFGAIGATANAIEGLVADGFEIDEGADVNSNLVNYYWACFGEGTSVSPPTWDPLLERLVQHEHRGGDDAVYDPLLNKLVRHPAALTNPTHDALLDRMVLHTHA